MELIQKWDRHSCCTVKIVIGTEGQLLDYPPPSSRWTSPSVSLYWNLHSSTFRWPLRKCCFSPTCIRTFDSCCGPASVYPITSSVIQDRNLVYMGCPNYLKLLENLSLNNQVSHKWVLIQIFWLYLTYKERTLTHSDPIKIRSTQPNYWQANSFDCSSHIRMLRHCSAR